MADPTPDDPTPDDPTPAPERGRSEGGAGDAAAGDRDRVIERRSFFTEGFRNLMKPLSELVETRLDHFNRVIEESRRAALSGSAADVPELPSPPYSPSYYGDAEFDRIVRPPGALEEELFLDRCACSSQCVSACPVQAIQVVESDDPRLDGTPFIDPRTQACVVCDELACMKVCPTGALQLVPRHLIHMGLAEVLEHTCLRTDGEECTVCVEKCPLGEDAIRISDAGVVEVREDGCVGCGVCEMYCPTEPRAIVVRVS